MHIKTTVQIYLFYLWLTTPDHWKYTFTDAFPKRIPSLSLQVKKKEKNPRSQCPLPLISYLVYPWYSLSWKSWMVLVFWERNPSLTSRINKPFKNWEKPAILSPALILYIKFLSKEMSVSEMQRFGCRTLASLKKQRQVHDHKYMTEGNKGNTWSH